jgi:predicted ATPase/class 3 adenylate cyclase
MSAPLIGAITFLFTDLEGSTRLWDSHPDEARLGLARHDQLIEDLIQRHGGALVRPRGEGDSRFAVFRHAPSAVAAACAIQSAFLAEPWPTPEPLRVRMALHTGSADLRDGDYYGSDVNRCARLRAAAHAGQILLSERTAELVRAALPDGATLHGLGQHRLKDLAEPERVYQLRHPDLPAEFPPLRSLNRLLNNLPIQPTSFVGRERDLVTVQHLLVATRLLTLTGTGGSGKTRLALHLAANVLDEFDDGVWVVELAPLADGALVTQAVASAVGVREEMGRPLLESVLETLRPRQALLVLDNCEHLIQSCAEFADRLLHTCPHLRVLATSREALGIAGEVAWRVPSLSLPEDGPARTLEGVRRSGAGNLFLERAVAATPDFVLTEHNAPAVADVCRRLDGIPLALELAAARMRALSVEQIAARLDDCFHLLTRGSRSALPRQQTLAAAVDWSYELLNPAERSLFARLSVFAGGWTLEAAEIVAAGDSIQREDVFDLLAELINKSLVVVDAGAAGKQHYRFLDPLRQYAVEKLRGAGEEPLVQRQHRDWFLALAEAAEPELWGPHQVQWFARLEEELDNLRASLQFSRTASDARAGLRLADALWHFWEVSGRFGEGREWLASLLPKANSGDANGTQARALTSAAYLALWQGDRQACVALAQQSHQLAQALADDAARAFSLTVLGMATIHFQAEPGRAASLLDEALTLWRRLGNERGIYTTLSLLGVVAAEEGDYSRAIDLLEEGLARQREHGDAWSTANTSFRYVELAIFQRDFDRALALIRECLSLYRQFGDKRAVSLSLDRLAWVASAQGRAEQAARLLGAAERVAGTIGLGQQRRAAQDRHNQCVFAVQQTLGEQAFLAARAEGSLMSFEEAVAYGLNDLAVVQR